ncbi:hypothetical protein C9374_010490 [Naegleria lovaniensis]|uniref:Dephospho-CoA kinase n=1 Tax=Naegleria lovaniensis TaxID=51637 RepID=A0AA88GIG9_NAELO|nr:uncharacterized protein C9374_010490 [Naegleria lovaniensis]KAG2374746.1 hypothetical protein C9374_010490 [Naegleria lovaniensis]
MSTNKLKTIGITGGICSGKSTMMNYLRELITEHETLQTKQQSSSSEANTHSNVPLIHFHIIPTDELGWKAYEVDTPCYHQVIEAFGSLVKEKLGEDPSLLVDAQTRQINRRVLGRIVFKDQQLMKKLTDIVWPEIRRLIEIEMKKAEDMATENYKVVCLIEAAVLVEADWQHGIDQVWVIDVSNVNDRLERLCKRNNLTLEEAQDRVNAQLSTSEILQKLKEHNEKTNEQVESVYVDTFGKSLEQVKEIARDLFQTKVIGDWK